MSTSASENNVTFGLKNVHYATYTETNGVITYEEPKPIPGAVELSLEPAGDLIEFYADDRLYYSSLNNQGYEGTLTIAKITDDFKKDVLGYQLDDTSKVLMEMADAETKPFALLFEINGDQEASKFVFYNCTASRPPISSRTKEPSTEVNANELSFKAAPIPLPEGTVVKYVTTAETPQEVLENWYTSVFRITDQQGGES